MQFEHQKTIYRGYDIRGKYPNEINETEAYKIGRAMVSNFTPKKVAVGRDIRSSSPSLFESLIEGITDQGADVIDLGVVSTPMVYFASGTLDVDMAVCITASHMTSEHNGIKICKKNAVPVALDSGITDIKLLVEKNEFRSVKKGSIEELDIKDDYFDTFTKVVDLGNTKFKIVIDPANMMGILEIEAFKMLKNNLEISTIYDEFDETCPNHEANPIKLETLKDLGKEVRNKKADIGVAFDGDADRTGFVDENGDPIAADIAGALMAKVILKMHPRSSVFYDLRSSRIVKKIVESLGGTAYESRVGHSYVKQSMKEKNASFGLELAGHYYFIENFSAEAGPLPTLILLKLMKDTGKPLSELVNEISEYYQSGEINSTISKAPEKIYEQLKEKYSNGETSMLDGIKIDFKDWWFNVRPSANEPVMRLNLEASTKELMEEKRDEILKIIQSK